MKNHDPFPCAGAKAIAALGPDYAPEGRVEVLVTEYQHPDAWICVDATGQRLVVRTRKLTKLSVSSVDKSEEGQGAVQPLATAHHGVPLAVSREAKSGH